VSQSVVEFHEVTKDFTGDFWKPTARVLRDISFEVGSGKTFGLIGPNGAGKTTVIKLLMGLLKPTRGDIFLLGQRTSVVKMKHHVGYLPENAYYYDYLKTEEIIDFYGRLFGYSRVERDKKTDELLELVGLADRKGLRLRHFSKGMLQRIGIAQALVNDPDLVILDEPMSGLDPIGRKEIREIILRLGERGKTILFSSHILSDVEAICQEVAILIKGELRAHGAIESLVQPQVKSVEVIFSGQPNEKLDEQWKSFVRHRHSGDQWILTVRDVDRVSEVLNWGQKHSLKLLSMTPHKETLEDIFIEKVEEKS